MRRLDEKRRAQRDFRASQARRAASSCPATKDAHCRRDRSLRGLQSSARALGRRRAESARSRLAFRVLANAAPHRNLAHSKSKLGRTNLRSQCGVNRAQSRCMRSLDCRRFVSRTSRAIGPICEPLALRAPSLAASVPLLCASLKDARAPHAANSRQCKRVLCAAPAGLDDTMRTYPLAFPFFASRQSYEESSALRPLNTWKEAYVSARVDQEYLRRINLKNQKFGSVKMPENQKQNAQIGSLHRRSIVLTCTSSVGIVSVRARRRRSNSSKIARSWGLSSLLKSTASLLRESLCAMIMCARPNCCCKLGTNAVCNRKSKVCIFSASNIIALALKKYKTSLPSSNK